MLRARVGLMGLSKRASEDLTNLFGGTQGWTLHPDGSYRNEEVGVFHVKHFLKRVRLDPQSWSRSGGATRDETTRYESPHFRVSRRHGALVVEPLEAKDCEACSGTGRAKETRPEPPAGSSFDYRVQNARALPCQECGGKGVVPC